MREYRAGYPARPPAVVPEDEETPATEGWNREIGRLLSEIGRVKQEILPSYRAGCWVHLSRSGQIYPDPDGQLYKTSIPGNIR